MMSLTRSQKKYIKENYKYIPVELIADRLNLSNKQVTEFLHHNNLNTIGYQDEENKNNKGYRKYLDKYDLYVLAGLLVGILLVYANSLMNDFVSDDIAVILEDPGIKTIGYVFMAPMGHFHSFIKFLIYSIAGETPVLHRIFNLLFHVGSTCTVYLLFIHLYKNKPLSLLVATLFAIHPAIAEPVVWISGLPYTLYTFLFFISFYCYIRSKEETGFFYITISIIIFILAILSTEKAIVLFLIYVLYEYIYGDVKKYWKKLSIFISLGFISTIYIISLVGYRVDALETQHNLDAGTVNPLLQVPIAITEYLKLLLFPVNLTLYHSELEYTVFQYSIRALIFTLLFILLIYIGVLARGGISKFFKFWEKSENTTNNYLKILSQNDSKYIFFWGAFFFIGLLPTLTPFKISWLVAERYMYISSVGIFAIFALVITKLSNIKDYRVAVYAITILAILILGIRTIDRNMDWKDADTLWIATAKASPSSPNAHNNLGDVYSRRGDLVGAAREFAKAVELKPNYSDAYHNLALTYWNIAKVEEDPEKKQALMELSRQNYATAIQNNPNLWQSYQNLGTTYYETGDYDIAIQYLSAASQINPNDIRIWLMLAVTYAQIGDQESTSEIMNKLLSLDPSNPQILAVQAEIDKILTSEVSGPQEEN